MSKPIALLTNWNWLKKCFHYVGRPMYVKKQNKNNCTSVVFIHSEIKNKINSQNGCIVFDITCVMPKLNELD